jgi:hypothetical protein
VNHQQITGAAFSDCTCACDDDDSHRENIELNDHSGVRG